MSVIVFRNKGVIDPKSIATFGVCSKETPGAIGFYRSPENRYEP